MSKCFDDPGAWFGGMGDLNEVCDGDDDEPDERGEVEFPCDCCGAETREEQELCDACEMRLASGEMEDTHESSYDVS